MMRSPQKEQTGSGFLGFGVRIRQRVLPKQPVNPTSLLNLTLLVCRTNSSTFDAKILAELGFWSADVDMVREKDFGSLAPTSLFKLTRWVCSTNMSTFGLLMADADLMARMRASSRPSAGSSPPSLFKLTV